MSIKYYIALLFLLLPAAGFAADAPGETGGVFWVMPPGQEARILSLVEPYETLAPVEPGTWFERIALGESNIDFVIVGREPPAPPVTLRARWDRSTASVSMRPSFHLETLGLTEETPANQRRSAELLFSLLSSRLDDVVLGQMIKAVDGQSWQRGGEPFLWMTKVIDEVRAEWKNERLISMGITQVQWSAVLETAPELPPVTLVAWVLLVILVLLGLGLRRFLRGGLPWEVAWAVLAALGGAAAWWLTAEIAPERLDATTRSADELGYLVMMHRDFAVASVFLMVGLAATIVAALVFLVSRLRQVRDLPWRELGISAGLLVGSLLVRFGLGGPDLLTDGGSGFERLLQYNFGYGGISVLLGWLLPSSLEAQVWPAITVTAAVAAAAPMTLYLLARELKVERASAVLAGLALLCWPLHAALFTSDFLQGPILTTGLFGLIWIARAGRTGRPAWMLVGIGVFGGLIWMRPDAMIWALPYAALAAPVLWQERRSGAPWLTLGFGLLVLGCRGLSYTQAPDIIPEGGGNRLTLTLEGFFLAGHASLPWWLWLGIPVGVTALWSRQRIAGLIAAGGLAAFLSLKVGGSPPDLLEFFRYLAPAMAWTSLVAGLGMVKAAGWVPAGRLRTITVVALGAGMAVVPLVHAPYLGTSYGPRDSDQVFREVVRTMPEGSGVVVPGEVRHDGLDPSPRYRYMGWEEADRYRALIPGNRALSAAVLVDFVAAEGKLPGRQDLDLAWGNDDYGEISWYFLRTGECQVSQGFHLDWDRDPGACAAVMDALDLELIRSWEIPYRNHRLVTQPRDRRSPKYDDDFTYELYRIRGLRAGS